MVEMVQMIPFTSGSTIAQLHLSPVFYSAGTQPDWHSLERNLCFPAGLLPMIPTIPLLLPSLTFVVLLQLILDSFSILAVEHTSGQL